MQDRPTGAVACDALRFAWIVGVDMAFLNVRLADDVLAKWRTHCAGINLKPSTAIRKAIEQQMSSQAEPVPEPVSTTVETAGGQKKVRARLWLTESEREGIRLRTTLHGGTQAGWIVNAIRSALTRDPQLGDDEIEVLEQSNYQLLSIGVNLNQIARRLNEGQKQQQVEVAAIEALSKQIDAHTDNVTRLIRSNAERWVIA